MAQWLTEWLLLVMLVVLVVLVELRCRYGYAGVLKVLLDAQANPCIADHQGQAPLHQDAQPGL